MELEILERELEAIKGYLASEIDGISFYLAQDDFDTEQKALRLISANREILSLVAQIEILRKTKTRIKRNMEVANDRN